MIEKHKRNIEKRFIYDCSQDPWIDRGVSIIIRKF